MVDLKEVQKKLLLLGDGAVGKTSLIRRFVVDKFDDKYILTIGSKVTAKAIQIDKEEEVFYLKLQIWDILGQKGYTKLHQSSFRGTDGVFMVADITRKSTLNSIDNYWFPKVKNLIGTVPFAILVNKSDLIKNTQFKEEDLRYLASKYNTLFFLTSAKNGENVKKAFYALGKRMLEFKGSKGDDISEPHKPRMIHPRHLFDGEKSNVTRLIDKIIDDFCTGYSKYEDAMPILRRQFELAKLDMHNPTKDALIEAIERLAKIEMTFKKKDIVEENRTKRLKWIKELM
ncbi:MAG: GTP-binding protein [Methanomassiliicoccales archaeon]|nr:MAG: GTP-binding protein [Methanomassiliicoccales archaeon]